MSSMTRRKRSIAPLLIVSVMLLSGCAQPALQSTVATTAPAAEPIADPVLLHLPGIAGARSIDRDLVGGLDAGGIVGERQIYDWTNRAPALRALVSREANDAEAQRVADFLAELHREDPRRSINVISHSGGCGIAVWALEKLPDEVTIDSLTMIAPALSPGYDLSEALQHVRGNAYNFYSQFDPILEYGTRMFGTIDGVRTSAAGRVGFAIDENSPQYAKLKQIPYDPVWRQFYNVGDHVGAMNYAFARAILAPLILTGELPMIATSQPTTQPDPGEGTAP